MGSEFIDRAKLEALANERSPHLSGVSRFLAVETFMAGVDATLALLDAETTEEWGVVLMADDPSRVYQKDVLLPHTEESAREWVARMHGSYEATAVFRRVTPWLPSEGGEKP